MFHNIFYSTFVTYYITVLYKVLPSFRNVSKKSIETFLFAHFEIIAYLCSRNHKFAKNGTW